MISSRLINEEVSRQSETILYFFIDAGFMPCPLKNEDASQHDWTPKEITLHFASSRRATQSYSYFINYGVALLRLEVNLPPPKLSNACVRSL